MARHGTPRPGGFPAIMAGLLQGGLYRLLSVAVGWSSEVSGVCLLGAGSC